MPRLLLLLTGGTLMMTPTPPGAGKAAAVTLDEERASRDLVAEVPSLARIASFETRLLFHMDSANMQPADWLTLAREVHAQIPKYDGIVVVHGTDTMAYTASALAMILGRCPSPSCSRDRRSRSSRCAPMRARTSSTLRSSRPSPCPR